MREATEVTAGAQVVGQKMPPLVTAIATVAVCNGLSLPLLFDAIEREVLRQTLALCNSNVSRTAMRLGIHRNTLARKMERWGLQ